MGATEGISKTPLIESGGGGKNRPQKFSYQENVSATKDLTFGGKVQKGQAIEGNLFAEYRRGNGGTRADSRRFYKSWDLPPKSLRSGSQDGKKHKKRLRLRAQNDPERERNHGWHYREWGSQEGGTFWEDRKPLERTLAEMVQKGKPRSLQLCPGLGKENAGKVGNHTIFLEKKCFFWGLKKNGGQEGSETKDLAGGGIHALEIFGETEKRISDSKEGSGRLVLRIKKS